MTDLRTWQETALSLFLSTSDDFLCVATPGAGKTVFTLAAFEALRAQGDVDRLIVVVPTDHLRRQWSEAANEEFEIDLDYKVANSHGNIAADMDGAVVTYAAVASNPNLWARMSRDDTLVVFDEVHHAGDQDSWGEAIQFAFQGAARRLLLSGTPWKSNGTPLPFAPYDPPGILKPHYTYDYGMALREKDEKVVRPAVFRRADGAVEYDINGKPFRWESLKDVPKEDEAVALRALLLPTSEWAGAALRAAYDELLRRRADNPRAGLLVVAQDKATAKAYQKIMSRIVGREVPIATSDEPEASSTISEFAESNEPVLIAVKMVSEGVDIKRLEVCLFASVVKTRLFFIQVLGRIVRITGADDNSYAMLFIPAMPPFTQYAHEIEEAQEVALREREEGNGGGSGGAEPVNVRIPLGADGHVHTDDILSSEAYSAATELLEAQAYRHEFSIASFIPDAAIARELRKLKSTAPLPSSHITRTKVKATKTGRVSVKKSQASTRVSYLAKLTRSDEKEVNTMLKQKFGSTTGATEAAIDARLAFIEELIQAARSK